MSLLPKKFELGIIEGFYGAPWSWTARKEYASFLASSGYSFYFYAPKADPFFRHRWREPIPAPQLAQLEELADTCHAAGIAFGVGFSPYEIYLSFDDEARTSLRQRIETFNRLGVDRLAILFDDMKNAPGLAKTQADILHWVRDNSEARELLMCPTYYSQDPVLDRIFGPRPADYLASLGRLLDPSIGVFWTGEEVCSKGYTEDHIRWVNELLGRKVALWDNYPVNDGPKMCKFLHLKAFQDRPAGLSALLRAHFVNPMNQPWLSRIPLLTLVDSYHALSGYSPARSFKDAATRIAGPELAARVIEDLELFQTSGLDQISAEEKSRLTALYRKFPHPLALEIAAWLEGKYTVTREVFSNQ